MDYINNYYEHFQVDGLTARVPVPELLNCSFASTSTIYVTLFWMSQAADESLILRSLYTKWCVIISYITHREQCGSVFIGNLHDGLNNVTIKYLFQFLVEGFHSFVCNWLFFKLCYSSVHWAWRRTSYEIEHLYGTNGNRFSRRLRSKGGDHRGGGSYHQKFTKKE